MPNLSSSLGTTQRYIPAVAPSQVGRYAGLMMVFTDVSALNLAVADERLNITDTSPIWTNGQVVAVAPEFEAGGCVRVWNVAGQHARKVIIRPGLSATLAADANVVLFAAGAPAAGTGANGDISVDWAGNAYYTKAAGTWASTGTVYAAGGGGATTFAALTDKVTVDLPATNTPLSTALALKAPLASPTFTGTVSGVTKAHVGLGNVDNTSDALKPVSTATATALAAKAPLASPTFTGTVTGVTKAHVGLGNVDNTSDTGKPVSTAQQAALDLKAPLVSPALTGVPTAPTAAVDTNTAQVATTAFVKLQPASALTSTQATKLAALADDITVDGSSNVAITGQFLPRQGTEATLMALTSSDGELAVTTDTGKLLLLSSTPGASASIGGFSFLAPNATNGLFPNNALTKPGTAAITYGADGTHTAISNFFIGPQIAGGVVGDVAYPAGAFSYNLIVGSSGIDLYGSHNLGVLFPDTQASAYGDYSVALGRMAISNVYCANLAVGKQQNITFLAMGGATVDATPFDLESPGAADTGAVWNPEGAAAHCRVTVIGKHATLNKYVVYHREFTFLTGIGIGTITTPIADYEDASLTAASVTLPVVGTGWPTVRVVGVAATSMTWRVIIEMKSFAFVGAV